MQTFIKDYIKALKDLPRWGLPTVVLSCVSALAILNVAWQYNNPKANQMTFWTYFGDVIQLKKLDQFQ